MNSSGYFLIASGSVLGALIRWQLNNNLLVNLLGSLLFGIIASLPNKTKVKLFFGTGFCASLTTFSSWIYTCNQLIENAEVFEALKFIFMTLGLGMVFVYIGFKLGKKLALQRFFNSTY